MNIIRYRTPRLTGWSSFSRLSALQDVFDSAFTLSNPSALRGSAPALDLHESDEQYTVRLEAPGARKEDFDISLEDDVLTISGNRRSDSEQSSFRRSVKLPAAVKGEAVQATYDNGILAVSLPRAEESKPRKINVSLN